LQKHANGAHRIDHVEMLSTDPAAAAAHMSRLTDMPVETEDDGARRVETGAGRGAFVFVNRAMLEARHPGVSLTGLPKEGAVVLALRVEDADQTGKALGALGRTTEPGVVKVAPQHANGVVIVFAEG
jgi:hypothetical protein